MIGRGLSTVAEVAEAVVSRTPLAQSSGDLLSDRSHRPWPVPDEPWLQAQTWEDLLFAHWPVPVEALRPLVPPQLPIDVYDGSAWLGVTPFVVRGLRARGTLPVPGLSSFPETNVRTYTTVGDKPGIWFFSLDADSNVAVRAARRGYRLPYFHSKIDVQRAAGRVRYSLERRSPEAPPAGLRALYWPIGEMYQASPGSLEHFLAERYCLYTVDEQQRILRGEIHHPPWPLQRAEASMPVNTMALELGLELSDPPPVLHFARRQQVLIWPLRETA
ncbi:MAG: YqjF family protein [Thermoleophilaceae bacterium]